ncbi:MAG: protease pro-enzyme activation domain-containing protein, partial [Streptosporangiaceae bacterium]
LAAPATASVASRVALPDPTPYGTPGTIESLSPGQQLNLRVYLAAQHPARLAAAALAVATPHRAGYARYLTPAQYRQRFGPTAAQTATVAGWLKAQNMTITATTAHYIAVRATVAEADSAFGTQVIQYVTTTTTTGPKGGTSTISIVGTTGGFSVPAALGADVASVTGFDQTVPPTTDVATESAAPSPAANQTAAATDEYQCSQYWGQHTEKIPVAYGKTSAPTQLCGYTPAQLRKAYGISRFTGKGATIAVVLNEAWPTMLADANRFFAANGIAGFAAGQYTENFGPGWASSCGLQQEQDGGNPGDPEEAIDVETAHIAAPDAKVVLVGADCANQNEDPAQVVGPVQLQDFLDATTRVVDGHLADVVTSSWGYNVSAADAAAWNLVFVQGALEGIGFDYSSGDGGSVPDPAAGEPAPVQFPASDPWVTAVGGTSLAIGRNGTTVADYPWGDNVTQVDAAGTGYTGPPPGDFVGGSGGGISVFAEPGYQKSVVPATLATDGGTSPAYRVAPDISADAGNNWLIGYTGALGQQGVYSQDNEGGGTSGASPLIAGLEADAMQATGHPLGFANPALYLLARTPAIHDVPAVNPAHPPVVFGASLEAGSGDDYLTTMGEDASPLQASAGYDDVTGLGAPGPSFVTAFRGL